MNAKIFTAMGFVLLAVAFFLSVHTKPEILHVGLVGITPTPAWWPIGWAWLLRPGVFFLIWLASSSLAVPSIVKAFFPEHDKIAWTAFLFFCGTYLFIYGLPKGWEWASMFLITIVLSQCVVLLFIKRPK